VRIVFMDSLRCTRTAQERSLATPNTASRPRHGGLPGFLQRHGAKMISRGKRLYCIRSAMRSAHYIQRCREGRPALRRWPMGVARTLYHPIWAPPSADELNKARRLSSGLWRWTRRLSAERGYITPRGVL